MYLDRGVGGHSLEILAAPSSCTRSRKKNFFDPEQNFTTSLIQEDKSGRKKRKRFFPLAQANERTNERTSRSRINE